MAWTCCQCCQCFPCGGGQGQQPLGRNPRCACNASRNSFLGSRPPRQAPLPERSRSGQWENRQWSPLIRSHTRAQGLLELITPTQSKMRSLAHSHWAGIWACHTLVPNGTIIVALGQMTGEKTQSGRFHARMGQVPLTGESYERLLEHNTKIMPWRRNCLSKFSPHDKWCTCLNSFPCHWSKGVFCVGCKKKVWIGGKKS